jgi:hypothetical protein
MRVHSKRLGILGLRLGCGEPLRPGMPNCGPAEPRGGAADLGDGRRLSAPWRPQPELPR